MHKSGWVATGNGVHAARRLEMMQKQTTKGKDMLDRTKKATEKAKDMVRVIRSDDPELERKTMELNKNTERLKRLLKTKDEQTKVHLSEQEMIQLK